MLDALGALLLRGHMEDGPGWHDRTAKQIPYRLCGSAPAAGPSLKGASGRPEERHSMASACGQRRKCGKRIHSGEMNDIGPFDFRFEPAHQLRRNRVTHA